MYKVFFIIFKKELKDNFLNNKAWFTIAFFLLCLLVFPLSFGASTNIQSIIDMTGNRDIYNKPLSCTEIAIADELACAAGLIMGQTNELMPVVLIKGFNKSEYETNDAINLVVNERNDLYR